MVRKQDTPCVVCGKMLWTGSSSKPADERACRSCRNAGFGWPQSRRRPDGTPAARYPGRVGRPWRRLRDQVLAEESDCFRCGLPVDKVAPFRTPLSASVDHIVALADGGAALDRANVALAHYSCNARAGTWAKQGLTKSPVDYAAALFRSELNAALEDLVARVGPAEALRILKAGGSVASGHRRPAETL